MEEKKEEQKIVPQEETEEKVETAKQPETKEEPVKDEQPSQEESAEQPKEELKENTLKIECGIDYDKLAEAIVRAQMKVEQEKEKEESDQTEHTQFSDDTKPTKKNKPSIIGLLSRRKQEDKVHWDQIIPFTSAASLDLMSTLIKWAGNIGIVLIAVWKLVLLDWSRWENCLLGATMIAVSFVILIVLNLYAALLKEISKQLLLEKDRNYIVSVFSAFSGFFALIVAFVALAISIVVRGI